MYLFTHLALAQIAAVRLQPAYLDEFAWGTVFPDIYWSAGIPRDQTHLGKRALECLQMEYPEQRSFIQGYRVHLLLDEIDLVRLVRSAFPLALSQKILLRYFALYLHDDMLRLLFEDHFLDRSGYQKMLSISGKQNAILTKLGLHQDMILFYAARARTYFYNQPIKNRRVQDLETELNDLYEIRNDICKYRKLMKNPLLSSILTLAVKNAGLEKLAMGLI